MKLKSKCLTLVSWLSMLAVSSLALADDDPNLAAIEARQSFMQVVKWNAGPLFGMAKGEIEYNAELAATLASNLAALASMNSGNMWVQGSDNGAYPDDTRALPEIWAADSEVGEKHRAWADAVAALEPVAGTGVEELRSGVGDVGQACKGCHDDYRAED